jgi:hypothetical protein
LAFLGAESYFCVAAQGRCAGIVTEHPGPKAAEPNPLAAELARLQQDNARLTRRLTRAEAIIDIQKKVAALLGIPLAPTDDAP